MRPSDEKQRLFACKEDVWKNFGYSPSFLEKTKSQSFWDAEFASIEAIDAALTAARAR